MVSFTCTAFFLMSGPIYNAWKLYDLFGIFILSCVIGFNNAADVFITISIFLGTYKCMRLYETHRGITLVMYGKIMGYKILRIAPAYYLVFFVGWLVIPYL